MRFIFLTVLACLSITGLAQDILVLPEFSASQARPRAVATTSIIGDVVAHVAGDAVDLHTLIPAGQDPHSYQAVAKDLALVERADVVFVNGWDLEEGVISDIEAIAEGKIAPVAAGVIGLEPSATHHDDHHGDDEHASDEHNDEEASDDEASDDGHHDHHNHSTDPHTWFSIPAVMQWVDNIAHVFSQLDPEHAELYQSNASAYKNQLTALHAANRIRFARVPADNRFLITNHDAFNYLAQAYDVHIVGTIIPSFSTQAEPSARDVAELISTMRTYQLCSIFTEMSGSAQLARAVARELDYCDDVKIISLYTGALGAAGSGADSYISMYRENVRRIIAGLE